MSYVQQLHTGHGVTIMAACEAVGLARATYYRTIRDEGGPSLTVGPGRRPTPARALSAEC